MPKKKIVVLLALAAGSAQAMSEGEFDFFGQKLQWGFTGYARNYVSMNLQDKEQRRPNGGLAGMNPKAAKEIGGAGQMSMNRNVLKFEGFIDAGWARLTVVERSAREILTPYLKNLQNSSAIVPARVSVRGVPRFDNTFIPLARGEKDFLGEYNSDELREIYVDFSIGPRLHFRLGRQQVAWGETDFLRALDVVQGYDMRWRSFIETENEELRKPGTMANITFDIPEIEGSLQLLWRPGKIDAASDYGNSMDLFGGRWAPTPLQGMNITSWLTHPNYHHREGDVDDDQYGLRWNGVFQQVGYSLAWWHGNAQNVVINCRRTLPGTSVVIAPDCHPWHGREPELVLNEAFTGEMIWPEIDVFGATANAYLAPVDGVLRLEAAYVPNQPWNVGTQNFIGMRTLGEGMPGKLDRFPGIANRYLGMGLWVPGLSGVTEKDTLTTMVGFDKNLKLMKWLKTSRPSVASLQVFDTWILGDTKKADIVEVITYGAQRREHSPLLTAGLFLNYDYDKINPGLAFGVDLQTGDAFATPQVNFAFGDHWRILAEADLFFPQERKHYFGEKETRTHALGTNANNSQFMLRTSYQF